MFLLSCCIHPSIHPYSSVCHFHCHRLLHLIQSFVLYAYTFSFVYSFCQFADSDASEKQKCIYNCCFMFVYVKLNLLLFLSLANTIYLFCFFIKYINYRRRCRSRQLTPRPWQRRWVHCHPRLDHCCPHPFCRRRH